MGWQRRRKRGRRTEPRSIADLMRAAYPAKEPREVQAIRAFAWWEKAVPRRVLQNARPVRVERGVLVVHARNPVWANELSLLADQLLAELNRVAPAARIRSIRVRVGELPKIPLSERRRPPPPPVVPATRLPEDLARELAGVRDDDVRDAITRAASVSLGRTSGS